MGQPATHGARRVILVVGLLAAIAGVLQGCVTSIAGASNGRFTEFELPITTNCRPSSQVQGPDHNFWFIEQECQRIGRLTLGGDFAEFSVPQQLADGRLFAITAGPDGNLWFTVSGRNDTGVIGRITPSGTLTQYPVLTGRSGLSAITAGRDGNLWFTERGGRVGRITPSGAITEFRLPDYNSDTDYYNPYDPESIVAGPDGNLWFTETQRHSIARITPTGQATRFPVTPFVSAPDAMPHHIAIGPDGNLWFTLSSGFQIGRMTLAGAVTYFTVPPSSNHPNGITQGPDGNLWFIEDLGEKLGRITPAGQITEYPLPNQHPIPYDQPSALTAGPDGNLWFIEVIRDKSEIVRLDL